MKKICLLLLCCVIFFCGCEKESNNSTLYENDEYKEFVDWLEEESKIEETLKNCKLKVLNLPKVLNFSYNNNIKAKIKIDKASYQFYEYDIYSLVVKIDGEVLYGNNEYVMIGYKLKDNNGNVVRTDHFTFTYQLSTGDKFKDYEVVVYDIKPGEYTIDFFDYEL